ncbi:MAG TPA: (2Fe-2S)-binding protein, partial [Ramlibacter sp.]|nr:(2Fe-2S)-binding protein [Ramlibacter sp.]
MPWTLLAAAWLPETEALAAREQLQALMPRFAFAACVPFAGSVPLQQAEGGTRTGVLFRAAAYEPPGEETVQRLEQLLGLAGAEILRYADKRKGQRRTIRVRPRESQLRIEGLLLAGDTSAEPWLKALLVQELDAQAHGRLLLAPGAKAPVALRQKGRQVCGCLGVDETAIRAHLAGAEGSTEERLASLQAALRCGTSCGSCVPELRRIVRGGMPVAQVA